jgi:hypothetical protein
MKKEINCTICDTNILNDNKDKYIFVYHVIIKV